jgi:hypothetical protein
MTPVASTAAGRRAATPRVVRAPRRVSGPVGGRAVEAPVRRPPRPAASPGLSLVAPIVARMRSLPDTTLVDRLVRGRAWIPVLGVMLAGIVAMQVEILKLGSSMGRWIDRSSALTIRNEQLRGSVAALADDQRIESLAAGMGMVMPAPTTLGFLSVRPGTVAMAAARIHSPDPAQFLAALPVATAATPPGGQSTTAAALNAAAAPATPAGGQSSTSASSTGTGPATTGSTTTGSGAATTSSTPAGGQGAAATSTGTGSQSGQASSGSSAGGGAAVGPPGPTSQSSGG